MEVSSAKKHGPGGAPVIEALSCNGGLSRLVYWTVTGCHWLVSAVVVFASPTSVCTASLSRLAQRKRDRGSGDIAAEPQRSRVSTGCRCG